MKKVILIILALMMLGTLVMGQSVVNQIGNLAADTYRVRNGPTDANDLFVVRGNTGNIGMGITSPLVRFHVFGAGVQRIRIQSSDNQAGIEVDGNSADGKWVIYNPQSSSQLRFHVLSAADGNGPRMTLLANGNVGIGTTTPGAFLHVAENSSGTDLVLGGSNISAYQSGTDVSIGDANWPTYVYIGQSSSNKGFLGWVYNATPASAAFNIGTFSGDNPLVLQSAGGNVGINQSNPAYKLDVNGEINKRGTGIAYRVNGAEAIWYNGYFSWGFGGTHNYFADDVQIGGTGFAPTRRLEVNDSQIYSVAMFENYNTTTMADGIRIQIGPDANPAGGNDFVQLMDGDGSWCGWINGNGTGGVTYSTTSDARLKMNIIDAPSALERVSNIKVRQYEMKSAPGIEETGFIAQELQQIYPQAVSGNPKDDVNEKPMGIDYGRITPLLVKAIQELQAEIEILKSR